MLLIDLDHFKAINDSLGHKGGDDALRHFVTTAATALRNEDVIGRLGGEEFAILLAGAGLRDAVIAAERVRAAIEQHPMKLERRTVTLTVSIGVAVSQKNEPPESMLDRADQAMYAAKRNGRNRVETLEAETVPHVLGRAA